MAFSKLITIKKKVSHKFFDFTSKRALHLKALDRSGSLEKGLCILSMLCKRDFFQYLVSIYSFHQFLKPEKIVIVNDGSLEPQHLALLKEKVPGIEILNGSDFYDDKLPSYTSWQRLQAIESYISRFYVIQLDADIFSRHDLDEVLSAYKNNLSFILGTRESQLITVQETTERSTKRNSKSTHVQHLAELNMHRLEALGLNHYVRGCAGFSGFAQGSFDKLTLIKISAAMFDSIGDKWREWGSEQVCTNILIANQYNAIILPLEYYDSVERYSEELKLIHFIGPLRFKKFIYNKLATRYINGQLNELK